MTISVPSAAAGLASHLRNGGLCNGLPYLPTRHPGDKAPPHRFIIYPELHGLKVYSVENARTQDTAEVRKQITDGQSSTGDPVPKVITLIVTEEQPKS